MLQFSPNATFESFVSLSVIHYVRKGQIMFIIVGKDTTIARSIYQLPYQKIPG
jgi:hypothetical protein